LITGVAGFIGFNLCLNLLKSGHKVVGIDSITNAYDENFKLLRLNTLNEFDNFSFEKIDLSNKSALEILGNYEIEYDVVYHLAARAGVRQSFLDPLPYITDNITATVNISNFIKKFDLKKFVIASTSSIYGNSGHQLMTENIDEKINPPSIYAATKLSGEAIARNILDDSNTNLIITRFFTVYGPFGRPDMSILRFIHWIANDLDLQVYGDGKQERSFTYIDDVVDLLIKTSKLNSSETINVGNNSTSSLIEVIQLIEKALNKQAKIQYLERAYKDPDVVRPNLENSKNLLNWEPKIGIEEGINKTVEWYIDNKEKISNYKYI
jgi:nucleoside-diphosphate-sugar epimerase